MTDWEALSKKLKALGVELGKDKPLREPRRQKYPIEEVVEGQFLDLKVGQVFCHEELYPREYQHGIRSLWPQDPLTTLCQWAEAREISMGDLHDFIFIDTETSGLAGGTGTYAFEIGVGRYTQDGFKLAQFFMRHPGEEPALLEGLENFMHGMKAIITYNGKSFDIPLLNTRYTMMGLTSPFKNVDHFDLLPLARRLWCIRLPSRTLGNVEAEILGVKRGDEEVPGYMIPEMYFDYLKSQDARPLAGIFYHNAIDILSLAGLFSHMASLLNQPQEENLNHGEDIVSLARFFESLDDIPQAEALYQKALSTDLPEDLYWDTIERYSRLLKRKEEWLPAIALWEEAALNDRLFAFEELAKYYEHQAKDLKKAHYWTVKGLDVLNATHRPAFQYQIWKESLDYRLDRLIRRISRADNN